MAARVNVGLLLLVPLTGCAAPGTMAGSAEAPPVTEVRSVGRCDEETVPRTLPPAVALVDTSALGPTLRQLTRDDSASVGRVVLTLGFQTDGQNMRRDVLSHSVSPLAADSVQKLVFSSMLRQPEAAREWGVRLLIDLGPQITYAVARREYCPPSPRSPEVESAMHEYLGTGVRYRAGQRERTVLVRIEVHPAGYVSGAMVVKGASSGGTLERDLATYVRQFSFRPATIDGLPVFGTLEVPIRVPE